MIKDWADSLHDASPTVSDVQQHAMSLSAMAASILTGLAEGKYAPEVKFTEAMLGKLSVVFPPAAAVEKGLEAFLWLNHMTAPRGEIVADGRGGFIPQHGQSVYDPATGRFTGEIT